MAARNVEVDSLSWLARGSKCCLSVGTAAGADAGRADSYKIQVVSALNLSQ